MRRAEPTKATILVTDASRGSSMAFLRSLARCGWRVLAGDADPRSAGFRSRYTAGRVLYPDPSKQPEAFAAAVEDAVRMHGVQLVVPVTDEAMLPLCRSRSRFDGLCMLAIPDADALEVTRDKQRTLALAERLGVPAPKTRLVCTRSEALGVADELRWPVVLKPQRSRVEHDGGPIESFEVRYAENREALAGAMGEFEGRCGVLLQEYVEGIGYGVEILADAGRPLAAFQHRRLRELPIPGGRSALRESAPLDPVLYGHATRLLEALEWTGLAMVEFRAGGRGAALMEINGRVWGSLPLAVHSGMDFPRRLAELYLLGPPGPEVAVDRRYRVGVRAHSLELELKWIASLLLRPRHPFLPWPRRRAALGALASLFDPRIHFDVQSLDDPRPGLADLARIARAFAARAGDPA